MLSIYLFLCLCQALQTQALSYWIDTSCAGKVDETTFKEIRQMGSEGGTRVRDTADQVMGAAFKQIFKVDTSDATASQPVLTAFDVTSVLVPTTNFKGSDLRIYCDNDARWELVPDLPNAGKKSKNSKKAADEQMWWDPVNFIFRTNGRYGCLDDGTAAQTYSFKDQNDKGVDAGHNPSREVITICTEAFTAAGAYYRLMSEVPATKDIRTVTTGLSIEDYEDMLSVTLFHELCHVTRVINIPGSDDESIGWENIAPLSAAQVLQEADPFAILGLTAVMNARNVRLAADATDQAAGVLDWITAPVEPTVAGRKRAMAFFS